MHSLDGILLTNQRFAKKENASAAAILQLMSFHSFRRGWITEGTCVLTPQGQTEETRLGVAHITRPELAINGACAHSVLRRPLPGQSLVKQDKLRVLTVTQWDVPWFDCS